MPAPSPNDFRNLIVSATGNLCDKLAQLLLEFPKQVLNWVSFEYTEGGQFSDEYKAMICALDCAGAGADNPANPNMPAPSGVSATDGTYDDKVRITWNAVTPPSGIDPVTEYKIYRSLSTNIDPTQAALLATVTAPTVTYDDSTALQGTTYNYWVVATNGTHNSAYAGPDVGHSAAASSGLAAVSDLQASQGFSGADSTYLHLWWTPVVGATRYDIYRGTTSVFASATKIGDNKEPQSTDAVIGASVDTIYDNTEKLVYLATTPSSVLKYFFWVVAKKDAPPATSTESNAAQGWIRIDATEEAATIDRQLFLSPYTVPAGAARMRMLVRGMGGGGAGGGEAFGGGGGGAAPLATLEFVVAPADVVTMVNTPAIGDTSNAAAMTNGTNGAQTEIKLNGVTILTLVGGSGGQYSASGGGLGGAIGSAAGSALVTTWTGLAGKPGAASAGGKQGAAFGDIRRPGAWYGGNFNPFTGWEGASSGGTGGSGAFAQVGVPSAPDSVGGKATQGSFPYATFSS